MIGIFLQPNAIDVSKIKYAANLLKIFDLAKFTNKVIIFTYRNDKEKIGKLVNHLSILNFGYSGLGSFINKILKYIGLYYKPDFQLAIEKYNIRFAIFPEPPDDINKCKIKFMSSIQSLGHRLNPELWEMQIGDGWIKREKTLSFICNNANKVLIDSEVGKRNLELLYNRKSNIFILEHPLPEEINLHLEKEVQKEILSKLNIKIPYIFLPAQFWPHKNHIRIVEAVVYLKNQGINVRVIFTGSDLGIRKKYNIEKIIKELEKIHKIKGKIIITGFLKTEEMFTLYKNAVCLVMPQLISEPCIPIAEAMALSCPVITSDLPGLREQLNGAGILVDPYDVRSIAKGIKLLNDDPVIRRNIITKGCIQYKNIEKKINSQIDIIRQEFLIL